MRHPPDLSSSRCLIWPFDLPEISKADPRGSWRSKTSAYLAGIAPRNAQAKVAAGVEKWYGDQYSAELWIQRALQRHPWRAATPEEADIYVASANFSLMAAGGVSSGTLGLRNAFNDLMHAQSNNRSLNALLPPKPTVVVLTNSKMPLRLTNTWGPKNRAILLLDATRNVRPPYDRQSAVLPYVLSRPELKADGSNGVPPLLAAIAKAMPPWPDRKLLYFVGHVPKVTINPTRFFIWWQLHREADVTIRSHTMHCTVGQFAICANPERIEKEVRPRKRGFTR